MADELLLIGVGSEGRTEQWDGLATEPGMILRWQAPLHLGFPPRGYELFRAAQPDFRGLAWEQEADKMSGLNGGPGTRRHEFHGGEVIVESDGDFAFAAIPGTARLALQLDPAFPVTLTFPDPAWFLALAPAATGAPGRLHVELHAGGAARETFTMDNGAPAPAPWRTRGIERVVLSGDGALDLVRYALLHVARFWNRVGPRRILLPVTDPAYPAATHAGSDADEAARRLPAGVDFARRYEDGFPQLRDALIALCGGAAPAPASAPAAGGAGPALTMGVAETVALACLDPHIARIAGLLLVDPVRMDGTEYAYWLRGLWAEGDWKESIASSRDLSRLRRRGVTLPRVARGLTSTGAVFAPAGSEWTLGLPGPVDELVLSVAVDAPATWTAYDVLGAAIATGTWPAGTRAVARRISAPGLERLVVVGAQRLVLRGVAARGVSRVRETVLPSAVAVEAGPPAAPAWTTVVVSQPGGVAGGAVAELDWDLGRGAAARMRAEPVLHQVAARTVPAGAPAPSFDRADLLDDGTPLLVPAPPPPGGCHSEFGLPEGERHWWVRGVDLMGRVSDPGPPAVATVADTAPPPPPQLVLAEYVQADLTAEQRALRAPSPPAEAWLAAHPDTDAVVAVWAWPPELHALCGDVDRFRVHVRRPRAGAGGPGDPATTYDGVPWGAPVAELGPTAIRPTGTVTGVAAGAGTVAVTAVDALDDTHALCATTLALDVGAGVLSGARLVDGAGRSLAVRTNGVGPAVTLTVEHPAGEPPAPGDHTLQAGTTGLVALTTDIAPPPLAGAGGPRRLAGVLMRGGDRLTVLRHDDAGAFLCLVPAGAAAVAVGQGVAHHPAFAVTVADTGFGPVASASHPVAIAQVAVTAVRGRGIEGPPGAPGTIAAVHARPPDPPVLAVIPSGPHCAQVATPADWFGVSRFTLGWTPTADEGYLVYRALGGAVMAADRAARTAGGPATPHAIPAAALPADPAARAAVQGEIAALDAALAAGDEGTVAAAYAALGADSQRLLAGQPEVEHVYTARQGVPLATGEVPFTDELDGRSRGHWFYRVAAVSRAGLEGPKSPPTPPICCPDVVGPQPPRAHQALARPGAVHLRWTRSPDADVARYLVFRTPEGAGDDVRDMQLVARLAPAPSATPGPGESAPQDLAPWLGHDDPAGPGEWRYRIVAEDATGNRSLPSAPLRGRALAVPPAAPVWTAPVRDGQHVRLAWSHTDARLSCQVERRAGGGGAWVAVSEWLPRGVYAHADRPPDADAAWDYRLRVRDRAGLPAAVLPVASLPAAP